MNKLKTYFDEVVDILESTELEMEKMQTLLEYGKELEHYPKDFIKPENKVPGCVSNVYISAELDKNGKVQYQGSSEALIVRGYVAILINGLSGLTPKEIVEHAEQEVEGFTRKTNIKASLTPSRANAFGNVFEMMKKKAKELL